MKTTKAQRQAFVAIAVGNVLFALAGKYFIKQVEKSLRENDAFIAELEERRLAREHAMSDWLDDIAREHASADFAVASNGECTVINR